MGANVSESYLSENSVQLYPNPTSGIFNLLQSTSDANQVEIYNSIGSLVYSAEARETNKVIGLTGNSAGIYFVNIKTEKGLISKKILKH